MFCFFCHICDIIHGLGLPHFCFRFPLPLSFSFLYIFYLLGAFCLLVLHLLDMFCYYCCRLLTTVSSPKALFYMFLIFTLLLCCFCSVFLMTSDDDDFALHCSSAVCCGKTAHIQKARRAFAVCFCVCLLLCLSAFVCFLLYSSTLSMVMTNIMFYYQLSASVAVRGHA